MKANSRFSRPVAAAAAFAALIAAMPAHAADVIGEEPPAPQPMPVEELPVASWAGPYAGIQLGYGFSGETRTPGNTVNTDGFQGGAFAGIQGQNGMFVYGIEGDVGYNGNEGVNAGLASEAGVDGSLRARLGVAATDRILVYGTAGGAAQRLEVADGVSADTNTMLGYTVGVGTDVKLTEQVFARGEYRYTDYGTETFNVGGGTSVDSTENKVMFGLGMKF